MTSSLQSSLAKVKKASRSLALLPTESTNAVLDDLADALLKHMDRILAANRKDIRKMKKSDPHYDRLALSEERIESMANDIRTVAALPSPLHRVLDERKRPNGLRLTKITVPLGVVGMIYEA